jgi:phosphoribosylformimino-5-aminoimidazole carboxamide ribotide isomerase
VELFPAIDIRNGRVVRLSQGEATRQTVYGEDPAAVAEVAVQRILERVAGRARIQAGGGYRSVELVRRGVELGVTRVVVGTAAAMDPDFLAAVAAALPTDHLAVGVDARDGKVAVRGWTETSRLTAVELAGRALSTGIRTLIYTDVARDGMLEGPDIPGALRLQEQGASVIVSGGVSSLADLQQAAEAGLSGAIVGRALYDGRFDLPQALRAAATPSRAR